MSVDFINRPLATLGELQAEVANVVDQLGVLSTARFLPSQSIATSQTPVAHGMGAAPTVVLITPRGDARVWVDAPSDSVAVYLKASAAVTVDVVVA